MALQESAPLRGSNTPGPGDGVIASSARLTRRGIRRLQTSKRHLSPFEKLVRACLLMPVYIPVALLLRAASRLGISMVLPGRTSAGATVMCRLTDLIDWYIWLFGEWEPDLTRFTMSRLRDGDVFVDVGANVGYYSLLAARSVGGRGGVVAIEASPSVFAQLCEHADGDARGDRIRLVNKAAAATAGTLTIFSGPAHNHGMSTTVASRGLKAESSIEALPLDHILTASEIAATRIIKIDVEGAEPDVLAGMVDLIPLLRPDAEIVVELSPQWWAQRDTTPADILKPFTDGGFHIYTMCNDYSPWRYLWPDDVTAAVRLRGPVDSGAERLDLVLSRRDVELLPM